MWQAAYVSRSAVLHRLTCTTTPWSCSGLCDNQSVSQLEIIGSRSGVDVLGSEPTFNMVACWGHG